MNVTTEAQDAPPGRLLNLGEAAAVAQVDPNTLAKWAAKGMVSAVRDRDGAWRKFSEAEMRALAPGKMLGIGYVAHLLHRHPKTIARWADEGKLPEPVRLPGGTRRFREEDVRAFLEAETGGGQ